MQVVFKTQKLISTSNSTPFQLLTQAKYHSYPIKRYQIKNVSIILIHDMNNVFSLNNLPR